MGGSWVIGAVGVLALIGCGGGVETATTPPATSTTVAVTTTSVPDTATTEPAVQLAAPTDVSFEARNCPETVRQGRNESCGVVAHFRDQSIGEDGYLLIAESDFEQTAFETDGPAMPGTGSLASTPPAGAMVGYRFCLTVYAVQGTTRSPASERLCARIADGGTIEVLP